MAALPPVNLRFDSGPWNIDHSPYFDRLSSISARFFTHPSVVRAFVPVFLGEYDGSPPVLSNSQEEEFTRKWQAFVVTLPDYSFLFKKSIGQRVFGITELLPEGSFKTRINLRLLEGFMDSNNSLRSDTYLFLILVTLAHEVGHGFSHWMRGFRSPAKLRVKGYHPTPKQAEWEKIKAAKTNVKEEEKSNYIEPDGTVGEAGYVVEREIFGGVVVSMSRKPEWMWRPFDTANIDFVCLDTGKGHDNDYMRIRSTYIETLNDHITNQMPFSFLQLGGYDTYFVPFTFNPDRYTRGRLVCATQSPEEFGGDTEHTPPPGSSTEAPVYYMFDPLERCVVVREGDDSDTEGEYR